MRIWPRKAGCEGRGGGGGGWGPHQGPHLPPAGERQSRYCKSGSLDSRYNSGGRSGGLTAHLVSPHSHCLTGLHLVPPPQTKLNSKGERTESWPELTRADPLSVAELSSAGGGRNRSRSRTRQRVTEDSTPVVDLNNKKISRVESLKNLILHGKAEPDLPPDVFNYPPHCSCR